MDNADIADLSYEAARDELVAIVARLEGGQVPLEDSLHLWERGEALADHCESWLDGAERRLRRASGQEAEAGESGADAGGVDEEDAAG